MEVQVSAAHLLLDLIPLSLCVFRRGTQPSRLGLCDKARASPSTEIGGQTWSVCGIIVGIVHRRGTCRL